PVHCVAVGYGEVLGELARVSGQRLDVASLSLGVDGIERERALAGTAGSGDDDQAVAGQLATHIAKVVLARAANDESVHLVFPKLLLRIAQLERSCAKG